MTGIKLTFTPTAPRRLGTIFVVDDNPIEREMLMDYFDKYPGIEVKGFPNGDDCLKEIILSNISPDMILMDYFLDSEVANSKDGLEILVKLKEISPNSAIIMHTSVDNTRIIELAKNKGAYDYIVKGMEGFKKLDVIIEKEFMLNTPESN